MGINELGQSLLLNIEKRLPISGTYSTGSSYVDEKIADFLDFLPGCQMANLYPFGTIAGKRKISFIEDNGISTRNGYRNVVKEKNYDLSSGKTKYFDGINSGLFVVMS